MKIAVLALQGAFIEHERALQKLGAPCVEIRKKEDLTQAFDGLILPGGESTVMRKLLCDLELFAPLREMIMKGLPVMGTCAGLLLLAKTITNGGAPCFGTMPMTARRNAYGRQLGSFTAEAEFDGCGRIPMTFIRAPYIERVDEGARALAFVGGKIVAARSGRQLATAFHPELGQSLAVHRYFLEKLVQT